MASIGSGGATVATTVGAVAKAETARAPVAEDNERTT